MLCTFLTLVWPWPLTFMRVAGVSLVSFTHSFYLVFNFLEPFELIRKICIILLFYWTTVLQVVSVTVTYATRNLILWPELNSKLHFCDWVNWSWQSIYCGIIRICGGIFLEVVGTPHPRIYILNEIISKNFIEHFSEKGMVCNTPYSIYK